MTDLPVDPGMLRFYDELDEARPARIRELAVAGTAQELGRRLPRCFAPRVPSASWSRISISRACMSASFRPPGEAPKPGVIYFHGGGWVLGSCETHDDMCAEMAMGADVVVVAVDYRLAPEHRHPAQLEDALKVLAWMREQGRALAIDPSHIVGAGDSAGGQMTVGLAMWLRDHDHAAAQRPGLDLSGAWRRRRHAVLQAQCRSAVPDARPI